MYNGMSASRISPVKAAQPLSNWGSHNRGKAPPSEWGIASDHYKPGYRAAHGLPYNGPDADIIEAPGGSIILYDSRTWHRAGINRTDHKRAAILQAMIPMYVMPKNDTSVDYKKFIHSSVYEELNQREKTEMQNLMVHYFIGPRGQYAISPDQGTDEPYPGKPGKAKTRTTDQVIQPTMFDKQQMDLGVFDCEA